MFREECWVLTTRKTSDKTIEESMSSGMLQFESREEALSYREHGWECEKNDIPRKVRITYELIE